MIKQDAHALWHWQVYWYKGNNSNLTKYFVFEVCMTASVKDICKLRQFATSVQFKTVYDIISFYR